MLKQIAKSKNFLRFASYWLYVFFAIGIPIIIIAEQYELIEKAKSTTLTGWGIIVAIIAVFFARKQIIRAIADMPKGITRGALQGLVSLIPLVLLNFVLLVAKKQLGTIQFIVLCSTISNLIACVFNAVHDKLLADIGVESLSNKIKGE